MYDVQKEIKVLYAWILGLWILVFIAIGIGLWAHIRILG